MVFWGVEVKSGKPFIHKYDASKGRLHVSMASLGLGSATMKSVLQCNVGDKRPVLLCSLYPGMSESLQLNLEYEEVDDVTFSVIGPRTIHLSGYYFAGGRFPSRNDDESESYGEDIAETESEKSADSDDTYGDDSFINDGVVEVFPPSPVLDDEEKKPKNKPRRRLFKSDHGSAIPKKHGVVLSSDDELPISASLKKDYDADKVVDLENDTNSKEDVPNGDENVEKVADESSKTIVKCEGNGQPIRQSDVPVDPMSSSYNGQHNGVTPTKKRKRQSENGVVKAIKAHKIEEEVESKAEDNKALNIANDKQPIEEEEEEVESKAEDSQTPKVAYCELANKNGEGSKKKRRKESKIEKKDLDTSSCNTRNDVKVDKEDMETPLLPAEENSTLDNGLVIEELQCGQENGEVAASGNKISVRYVCKLKNSEEVVDSNSEGRLFKFRLGANRVIDAWEVGVEGMRVGEKRRLTVPPLMGYGSEGDGKNIPPDSWLVYEVELVKVR